MATGINAIATELEVKAITGSSVTVTTNKCCTKDRAIILGADPSYLTTYADNLLVKYLNIVKVVNSGITFTRVYGSFECTVLIGTDLGLYDLLDPSYTDDEKIEILDLLYDESLLNVISAVYTNTTIPTDLEIGDNCLIIVMLHKTSSSSSVNIIDCYFDTPQGSISRELFSDSVMSTGNYVYAIHVGTLVTKEVSVSIGALL